MTISPFCSRSWMYSRKSCTRAVDSRTCASAPATSSSMRMSSRRRSDTANSRRCPHLLLRPLEHQGELAVRVVAHDLLQALVGDLEDHVDRVELLPDQVRRVRLQLGQDLLLLARVHVAQDLRERGLAVTSSVTGSPFSCTLSAGSPRHGGARRDSPSAASRSGERSPSGPRG